MNPHGVSDQLNLEKLSSGCLRVERVRQKPATPCVETKKHKTINLKKEQYHDQEQRSSGSEGNEQGQATAALNVERTLCASGEGLSPLSSQSHHPAACTTGVDAGAHHVAATVAR